ncbi:hypothetical protein D3C85_576760 [compost metagenome]
MNNSMSAREWHQWRDRYYAKRPKLPAMGKTFVREHAKDSERHSELVNAPNDRAAEQYIEERFVQF